LKKESKRLKRRTPNAVRGGTQRAHKKAEHRWNVGRGRRREEIRGKRRPE